MKIKTKLAFGIGILFVMMLAILLLNTYYIRILAHDAGAVIKDNYISIDHVQNMQHALAGIYALDPDYPVSGKLYKNATQSFERNLKAAINNVSEQGEKKALDRLQNLYSSYTQTRIKSNVSSTQNRNDSASYFYRKINEQLALVYRINRNAILKKNDKAINTANAGIKITTVIGTVFLMFAFSFIVNFPGYIANPIRELSEKIHAIADRNFDQRLEFSSNDEFGMLANSFNHMAKQLHKYQKSTIAELLVEKKRIENIINNLDEGIFLLDAQKNIIVANPAAARLINIHEMELIGRPLATIAQNNATFGDIVSDLDSNTKKSRPLRIIINDEESFYQKQVQPVYTFDEWKKVNVISGYVIFLKNITEFKKQDIAKTNFLATISHELKTPLSSINLSLKLLQDRRIGELGSEQIHLVDNISHESQRLLRFVNELLEYTKNESGNIKLRSEKITPLQIIQYSLDTIKPTLEHAHISAEIYSSPNLPAVLADIEKTVWVLTNLLGNAARYSPENSVITISAENRQNEIIFSVADKGSGIDPAFHTQIFERFVKVNYHNKKSGTGLGLAIAKDFIEAQNGRIWVESEPGKGSKFSFTLQKA